MIEYSEGEILSLIANYARARSLAQITATSYRQRVVGGEERPRELLLCMILDVDDASSVLSLRQQEAIQLMQKGLTQEEIANVLGIGQQRASTRISRAVRKMCSFLEKRGVRMD